MVSLKKLLARNSQHFQQYFIKESIIVTSPQDVASQIFRKVELSVQRYNLVLFNNMLKVMEECRDQETKDLAIEMRTSVQSGMFYKCILHPLYMNSIKCIFTASIELHWHNTDFDLHALLSIWLFGEHYFLVIFFIVCLCLYTLTQAKSFYV